MTVVTDTRVLIEADELERLRRAEALAIVYGWCAVNRRGPREEVACELWNEWMKLAGQSYAGPKAHGDIDARVKASEREWKKRR
jgi:hypothetical protein